MASSLGVCDWTRFEAYRSAFHEELDNSNAFVLCSNWEGVPRTNLEATRSSLPVAVSDVGGANEAVFEGQTGFLYPLRRLGVPDPKIAGSCSLLRIASENG